MPGLIRRLVNAIRNPPTPERRDALGLSLGAGAGIGFGASSTTSIGALAAENIATITSAVQGALLAAQLGMAASG